MKVLSFIAFSLISVQAQAGLHCSFDGSLGKIASTEIVVSRGGQISAATVVTEGNGQTKTVWNETHGTLADDQILILTDVSNGIGTSRYSIEKKEAGYDLVETFQCDHINGEERCNVQSEPSEIARKAASCQLN